MAQHNLTLFDASGLKYSYEDSQPNLDTSIKYVKATVTGGIWILYRNANYNVNLFDSTAHDVVVIEEPVSGLPLTEFSPGSAKRCENNLDSCTVFEHNYYGGHDQQYTEACFDVGKDFPNTPNGASSIIIWPNKDWQLFTKPDFQGGSAVAKDGWHPTPGSMGFPNDKLRSLRPR